MNHKHYDVVLYARITMRVTGKEEDDACSFAAMTLDVNGLINHVGIIEVSEV